MTSIFGPLNQFLRCFKNKSYKEELIPTLRTKILSYTFAKILWLPLWVDLQQSANDYAIGWATGFLIPVGATSFLFSRTSKELLEPNVPPIQEEVCGGGGLSPGVKYPGPYIFQLSSSSAEVKSEWSYTSASPIRLHRVDRDKFNFNWIWLIAWWSNIL